MTADDGKMQEQTALDHLSVVTALISDSDTLTRETVQSVVAELRDDPTRLYVYVHQSAYVTELAVDLLAQALGKTKSEVHGGLAMAIAATDWRDGNDPRTLADGLS